MRKNKDPRFGGTGVASLVCVVGAIVACSPAQAQRYERTLGVPESAERAFDIEPINDLGDYVTAGGFGQLDTFDAHLARYDYTGAKVWDLLVRGPGIDVATSVDVLSNGDLVVAGWSTPGTGASGLETLVMRLTPGGSVVWANRYPGRAFTDQLHGSNVGPAVAVGEGDAIFVTSVLLGAPIAMRLRPEGTLIWANEYFYPLDDLDVVAAFTDVKVDPADESVVISGTARLTNPGLGGAERQDAMIVRLQRENGQPVLAARYDLNPGGEIDIPETGKGLDISPETRDIVVAGEADRGIIGPGPVEQMVLVAEPSLSGVVANMFATPNGDSVSGSAAVRFTPSGQEFAVAGSYAPAGGQATISLFSIFNATLVTRSHSADRAGFDAIAPASSCGWLAAGQIDPPAGGSVDLFHAKTTFQVFTGCNDLVEFTQERVGPVAVALPLEPESLDTFSEASLAALDPEDAEFVFCRLGSCAACVADFLDTGTVDIFDVLTFVNLWNMGDPQTDLDLDGDVNILDVVLFINLWNMGC